MTYTYNYFIFISRIFALIVFNCMFVWRELQFTREPHTDNIVNFFYWPCAVPTENLTILVMNITYCEILVILNIITFIFIASSSICERFYYYTNLHLIYLLFPNSLILFLRFETNVIPVVYDREVATIDYTSVN